MDARFDAEAASVMCLEGFQTDTTWVYKSQYNNIIRVDNANLGETLYKWQPTD